MDSYPYRTLQPPLHELTKKGQNFKWDASTECTFALPTAPVLEYPDPARTFILVTDVSNVGLGMALSQVEESGEQVVANFSQVLSAAEWNDCVTRRELLAVVATLHHFRPYLYEQSFRLRTDHASLTWRLSLKENKEQLRWLEQLQDCSFTIDPRRGGCMVTWMHCHTGRVPRLCATIVSARMSEVRLRGRGAA